MKELLSVTSAGLEITNEARAFHHVKAFAWTWVFSLPDSVPNPREHSKARERDFGVSRRLCPCKKHKASSGFSGISFDCKTHSRGKKAGADKTCLTWGSGYKVDINRDRALLFNN
jgi:hypothetical protein